MLNLTQAERLYLDDMHALTKTGSNEETLVGLTKQQSEQYLAYGHARLKGQHPESDAADQYLALDQIHHKAKLAALAAEIKSREG